MKRACIVSVGYERRSVEELLELLAAHGVEKLVDIRELPLSRRQGFSKRQLARSLGLAGIEYLHLRAAGNPFRKERADVERCLQLYESYLEEHPEVLEVIGAELAEGTVAFLCYERRHDCCHRSVLLDALIHQGRSLEVVRVE